MRPHVTTALAGLVITSVGLLGLAAPERMMGLLGFTVLSPSRAAAALGEIRAAYGGLFAVMGVYTLQAAFNPGAYRQRLLLIGLLWLGAAAGRVLGAYLDGNPGLLGWLTLAFECVIGGGLTAVSAVAESPATA